MKILEDISLVLEALITLLALLIAIRRKRLYGLGLAVTFGIYVYYDYVKMKGVSVPADNLSILFLIATLSALFSVWSIYKRR